MNFDQPRGARHQVLELPPLGQAVAVIRETPLESYAPMIGTCQTDADVSWKAIETRETAAEMK